MMSSLLWIFISFCVGFTTVWLYNWMRDKLNTHHEARQANPPVPAQIPNRLESEDLHLLAIYQVLPADSQAARRELKCLLLRDMLAVPEYLELCEWVEQGREGRGSWPLLGATVTVDMRRWYQSPVPPANMTFGNLETAELKVERIFTEWESRGIGVGGFIGPVWSGFVPVECIRRKEESHE